MCYRMVPDGARIFLFGAGQQGSGLLIQAGTYEVVGIVLLPRDFLAAFQAGNDLIGVRRGGESAHATKESANEH